MDAIKVMELAAEVMECERQALDDLVHDLKSKEASTINNCGVEVQVKYLIKRLGLDGARQAIREL